MSTTRSICFLLCILSASASAFHHRDIPVRICGLKLAQTIQNVCFPAEGELDCEDVIVDEDDSRFEEFGEINLRSNGLSHFIGACCRNQCTKTYIRRTCCRLSLTKHAEKTLHQNTHHEPRTVPHDDKDIYEILNF